ncbi:ATP-binding protein [Telmatospirillum sp. J64-1]|uniref:ATP-binding response regulator n=1 Tax=Telmatospirillum sp. J64-1 TaxID=2502183 RepID=UPI00115DC2D4|nr:ATP-binding protein [Telmatospirillum sp. J64-1]
MTFSRISATTILAKPKILLVDRDPEHLFFLGGKLNRTDCELVTAQTGNEVLARCVAEDFALVLLTVDLPEMEVFEVAALLKEEESTRHIPILFIDPRSCDSANRHRAYAVGAIDYIEGPVDDIVLAAKVSAFLELQSMRMTLQRQLARGEAMRVAAKESELRFRQALTDSPFPVLLHAEDGEVIVLSRKWSELTGYAPHEDPSIALWVARADGAPSEDGLRREGQFPIHTAEGQQLLWDFTSGSLAPLPDGRRLTISMAVDITERSRAEQAIARARHEAERANLAKSHFLAAASHDLRQPLHALGLYLELLSQRMPEGNEPPLVAAKQCVEILSEQLNDLLDVSKLETGATSVAAVECRIGDILAKVMTSQKASAEAKGIVLRLVETNEVVRTDPGLFERLMLNLVSNAVKYTPRGKVLVGLRRRQGRLRVEVWDTGIGIPEDSLLDIFNEFHQLDNPSRDRAMGSGLGLAIVERAAKLLGVTIDVRSQLGKGSVFTVSFPQPES